MQSYFLGLSDAPGSSCIFPASVLESAISPRSPGSFYWTVVLETNHGSSAYCYWGIVASRTSQQREQGDTCVHTNPRVYTYQ